ncbi:MAG: hypothetical protein GY755_03180 [Chloroflexi bacterium]|nr:hypothetical protein [Chloroflexota bacterium]
MKTTANIFTIILQFILGYLFLFFGTFLGLGTIINELGLVSAENPDPWWNTPLTFITFVLTASFGVWLVGLLAAKIRKTEFNKKKIWWSTFAGSAIGIAIVTILYLFQGAVGFLPLLVAVVGALLGYYLIPKFQNS